MSKSLQKPGPSHESLCRRCGKCCRAKFVVEDIVFYGKEYCQYLDVETMLCTVYDQRFLVNPECASVETGIKHGILPGDCPYVADVSDYIAPVEEWEDAELEELIREASQGDRQEEA